jgi:hypothetical protein
VDGGGTGGVGRSLVCGGRLADGPGEEGGDGFELAAEGAELLGFGFGGGVAEQGKLRLFLAELGLEHRARAGDGVALFLEQALDAEGHLNVAAAVEALAGATFVGAELRELALPKAQDVGGDFAEAGDFADAEVELVRYIGHRGAVALRAFTDWLVVSHLQTRIVNPEVLK